MEEEEELEALLLLLARGPGSAGDLRAALSAGLAFFSKKFSNLQPRNCHVNWCCCVFTHVEAWLRRSSSSSRICSAYLVRSSQLLM